MGQKIIFLDVDGTLSSYTPDRGEYIPHSAREAIRLTREKGNLVYLCTGRSLPELEGIRQMVQVDGAVGGAGAFICQGEEILYHRTMDSSQVRELMDYLGQDGVAYYLECNSGLYTSPNMGDVIKVAMPFVDFDTDPFFQKQKPVAQCSLEDVNKVSFTSITRSYDEIYAHLSPRYSLVKSSYGPDIPGVWGGEISLPGVNKGAAIRWLLDYLKIPSQDSYAFGDSMNDLEMFQTVHTAIAMGNSRHGVEAHAQYQTTDMDQDGIYNGMAHFGLI